jgi:MFS family permease
MISDNEEKFIEKSQDGKLEPSSNYNILNHEDKIIDAFPQENNQKNLLNEKTALNDHQAVTSLKPVKKKCCFVELNEGVSYFNLFTYYLVQFSYVMAFTFIDSCQDYLLESKDYEYKISKEDVGKVNGDILLFDTLYLIAFIYIYGSFHDIFGRKILVVYGFLSMALSLYLYPLAGNVYPNLILVRLIFSNGICAVTTQPLLADYVSHKTKGFGGGIAAVVSGLGAIFAALFLLKLQSYLTIAQVYSITSGICVVVAVVCTFGVKNIQRRDHEEENICKRL